MREHARHSAQLFLLGALLFALKRTLLANALEPEVVRVHAAEGKDREHIISQALLARYALDENIAASDPVLWERLRALFPELTRAEATMGKARFEREIMQRARDLRVFEDDALLRNRLAFDAETVLKAQLKLRPPSEAELEDYLAQHREHYMRPASVRFHQLFISRQRHGAHSRAVAEQLRAELGAKRLQPGDVQDYGEASNWPRHMTGSLAQVERLFGGELAQALSDAPLAAWSEPVASALGYHLLWLEQRTESGPSALSEVRQRVLGDYLEQQRELALRDQRASLRSRYRVEITP